MMPEKIIQELEKVQLQVGTWLLGGKRWSAAEAVRGELGWTRIKDKIVKAKAEFFRHVMVMGDLDKERWVYKAMMEGIAKEGVWWKDWNRITEEYGLQGIIGEIQKMSKGEWMGKVKQLIQEEFVRKWKEGVVSKSSLKWYRER